MFDGNGHGNLHRTPFNGCSQPLAVHGLRSSRLTVSNAESRYTSKEQGGRPVCNAFVLSPRGPASLLPVIEQRFHAPGARSPSLAAKGGPARLHVGSPARTTCSLLDARLALQAEPLSKMGIIRFVWLARSSRADDYCLPKHAIVLCNCRIYLVLTTNAIPSRIIPHPGFARFPTYIP